VAFRPRVCVVVPCRGEEPGLERNLQSILNQVYPDFQTVFVTDTIQDPAYPVVESLLARNGAAKAQLLISNPFPSASGKVAALLTALEATWGQADVYAFIDSDSEAHPTWLAQLVDPLSEPAVGATTGFRWYFPDRLFWSGVEAAWNASGTNLLFDDRFNFPWGGSMALRSDTLESIRIGEVWANAVSDDMTVNRALRSHGYRIVFLPQCTVATFNKTSFRGFIEWATRQTTLIKVFNRGLWNYALLAYGLFDTALLLGVAGFLLGLFLEASWFLPGILLVTPSLLGVLRSYQRCLTFKTAMPYWRNEFEKTCFKVTLASPIVQWVMAYCIFRSAVTRRIVWRGRTYMLFDEPELPRSR